MDGHLSENFTGFLIFILLLIVIIGGMYLFRKRISNYTNVEKKRIDYSPTLEDLSAIYVKEKFPQFDVLHACTSNDERVSMFINKGSDKLCVIRNIGDRKDYELVHRIYEAFDIVEVNADEDGIQSIETVRKGALGRAVAGAVIAGGFGAVVGGLSATSRSTASDLVQNVSLNIVVDDENEPAIKVCFLQEKRGVRKQEKAYQDAKEKIALWHGLISVMIHRAKASGEN